MNHSCELWLRNTANNDFSLIDWVPIDWGFQFNYPAVSLFLCNKLFIISFHDLKNNFDRIKVVDLF